MDYMIEPKDTWNFVCSSSYFADRFRVHEKLQSARLSLVLDFLTKRGYLYEPDLGKDVRCKISYLNIKTHIVTRDFKNIKNYALRKNVLIFAVESVEFFNLPVKFFRLKHWILLPYTL